MQRQGGIEGARMRMRRGAGPHVDVSHRHTCATIMVAVACATRGPARCKGTTESKKKTRKAHLLAIARGCVQVGLAHAIAVHNNWTQTVHAWPGERGARVSTLARRRGAPARFGIACIGRVAASRTCFGRVCSTGVRRRACLPAHGDTSTHAHERTRTRAHEHTSTRRISTFGRP